MGVRVESSESSRSCGQQAASRDTAQRGKAATKHAPSPPSDGGEGRGEEGPSFPKAWVRMGCPAPRSSPHSCVVGRGRAKCALYNWRDLRKLFEILVD